MKEPREVTVARNEAIAARHRAQALDELNRAERARLPLLVSGLLDALPPQGEPWSAAKRGIWLEAMRMNLDLLYPTPGSAEQEGHVSPRLVDASSSGVPATRSLVLTA